MTDKQVKKSCEVPDDERTDSEESDSSDDETEADEETSEKVGGKGFSSTKSFLKSELLLEQRKYILVSIVPPPKKIVINLPYEKLPCKGEPDRFSG